MTKNATPSSSPTRHVVPVDRSVQQCPVVSVTLVVPVFNEEATIPAFLERISTVFSVASSATLDVIFVNDGSDDQTLDILLEIQSKQSNIGIVDLTRNFGKEAALSAGLAAAKGQVIVPIDVDLQDPPELIFEMIDQWRQGYDVVLARRSDRGSDTLAKRTLARGFYRLHNRVADTVIPHDVGDFRLMDQTVVAALNDLPESRRFMKGLFAWVGFRTTTIDYVRDQRSAGTSKFNGWRLWNFALEGLTSFSTAPLRIWTYIGTFVASVSFLYGMFIMIKVLLFGVDTPGFASIFVTIAFLGGLQLIGIGIIGEYLGRTYLEAKRRPAFLVRHIYKADDD